MPHKAPMLYAHQEIRMLDARPAAASVIILVLQYLGSVIWNTGETRKLPIFHVLCSLPEITQGLPLKVWNIQLYVSIRTQKNQVIDFVQLSRLNIDHNTRENEP